MSALLPSTWRRIAGWRRCQPLSLLESRGPGIATAEEWVEPDMPVYHCLLAAPPDRRARDPRLEMDPLTERRVSRPRATVGQRTWGPRPQGCLSDAPARRPRRLLATLGG